MKTLAKQFDELMARQEALGCNLPHIQKQEMNRAFMAGAGALFFTIMNDVSALPDAAAEAEMQKIDNEIRNYFTMLAQAPVIGLGGN